MSQPSTITNEVRARTTQLLRHLDQVNAIVDLIEDPGTDDAARLAFFQSYFDSVQGYDIDINDFTTAIAALRSLNVWLDANRPAISKLFK